MLSKNLIHPLAAVSLKHFLSIIIAVTSLSAGALSYGKTVYISDVLYVPLRSGQGNEYRIVNKGIKSGAALTFLEEGETGDWSKVRTGNGTEGWIKNQYLIETQPAELRLSTALTELARIKQKNAELAATNKTLSSQNNQLSSSAKTANASENKMATELQKIKELSAGAVDLDKRYRTLLKKHEMVQTDRDTLQAENESLKSNQKMNFLFYGAGILILGMIIAVVLPMLKPKKQYSDWA